MKAYAGNKITEVEIKDENYSDYAVEAVIKSGIHTGIWTIIQKKDLIKEPEKKTIKAEPKKHEKPTIKDVDFSKHYDYSFGETRYFWRADLGFQTIATMCRTKAECIAEARRYLRSL